MADEMICNYKKCRKRLTCNGWVTSCSHIFCDEDGTREFNKNFSCPACNTNLPGKFDIIRIDLSPTEQYKSMVLAGQKPEVILEVCSRAMAFWTYQVQQERVYQEHVASKAKDVKVQLEQYYEQLLNRVQAEANSLKNQNTTIKKELETVKKQYQEISDKIKEKSRQHQKLQLMYDALRRQSISITNLDTAEGHTEKLPNFTHPNMAFEMPLSTEHDPFTRHGLNHGGGGDSRMVHQSPAERDFVLNLPNGDSRPSTPRQSSTPRRSSRRHQARSDNAVQSRFSLDFFGTPTDRGIIRTPSRQRRT